MGRRAGGIAGAIVAGILLLATLVMLPRLLTPDFGLLDDGVSLFFGSLGTQRGVFHAVATVVQADGQRGRFHPVHWAYLILQFRFGQYQPLLWFSVNCVLLGATGIIIARIAWLVSKDRLAATFSGAGYVLLPSTFENYYTLSKSEPLLVFWLVTSAWLLFESIEHGGLWQRLLFGSSCAFLGMAYYTKETALAMVITTGIWAIFELVRRRHSQEALTGGTMRLYLAVNVVFLVSFFLARRLSGVTAIATGDDSRHYMISAHTILGSALRYTGWYLRDYPHVLTALGYLWVLHVLEHAKRRASARLLVIGVSWIIGSIALMLPWHSSLLYYLLPGNPGAAMILGLGLSNMIEHVRHQDRRVVVVSQAALALFISLAVVSGVNGFTHGRIQIAVDRGNAAMVDALVSAVPQDDQARVYFPADTEYLFELEAHLKVLKQRHEIDVEPAHKAQSDLAGSDFFVVVPDIKNQPFPTVRIGMDEPGAKVWQERVAHVLAGKSRLVAHISERVPLAIIALDKPILGLLLGQRRWERIFYSGRNSSWLDFQEFEYGWRIYAVSP